MGIRFTASANGGSRNLIEAAKFKRMGVSPGFPDIFIPIPIFPYRVDEKGYHGLFIELKRKSGGKLSDYQIDWLEFLRQQGYWADCCAGFDEAKDVVLRYLALIPKAA
jgi:hypothetical protein